MKTQRGFTLIEVMIAVVLLFITITAVSQIYKTTLLSSEKATRAIAAASVVPLLLPTIEARLATESPDGEVSQQGIMLGNRFQWKAKVIERSAPPELFSPDDEPQQLSDKFYLWQVDLQLGEGDFTDHYQTHVVAWRSQ